MDLVDVVPSILYEHAEYIVASTGCDLFTGLVASIGAFSGAVGGRMRIRPRGRNVDGFEVAGNLFTVITAGTGHTKTGILTAALKPLEKVQSDLNSDYLKRLSEYKQKLRTTPKKDRELEERPVSSKVLVNDCSLEALHEILSRTPEGVLMLRDELLSLLRSFDSKGYEQARSFYCTAWNGVNPYTLDRIIRGTVIGNNMCLSLMGSITKERLIDFVRTSKNKFDDGFVERLQLLVFVGEPIKYASRLVSVKSDFLQRIELIYKKVIGRDRSIFGSGEMGISEGYQYLLYLFDSDTQVLVDYWYDETWHDYLVQHSGTSKGDRLSKYRSLAPKLAMLFQILEDVERGECGSIGVLNWKRALWWLGELERHGDKLESSVVNYVADSSLQRLKRLFGSNTFTVREVVQHKVFGRNKLSSAVRDDLNTLVQEGLLKVVKGVGYRVWDDEDLGVFQEANAVDIRTKLPETHRQTSTHISCLHPDHHDRTPSMEVKWNDTYKKYTYTCYGGGHPDYDEGTNYGFSNRDLSGNYYAGSVAMAMVYKSCSEKEAIEWLLKGGGEDGNKRQDKEHNVVRFNECRSVSDVNLAKDNIPSGASLHNQEFTAAHEEFAYGAGSSIEVNAGRGTQSTQLRDSEISTDVVRGDVKGVVEGTEQEGLCRDGVLGVPSIGLSGRDGRNNEGGGVEYGDGVRRDCAVGEDTKGLRGEGERTGDRLLGLGQSTFGVHAGMFTGKTCVDGTSCTEGEANNNEKSSRGDYSNEQTPSHTHLAGPAPYTLCMDNRGVHATGTKDVKQTTVSIDGAVASGVERDSCELPVMEVKPVSLFGEISGRSGRSLCSFELAVPSQQWPGVLGNEELTNRIINKVGDISGRGSLLEFVEQLTEAQKIEFEETPIPFYVWHTSNDFADNESDDYLERKNMSTYGLRFKGGFLMVPVFDCLTNKLISVQTIRGLEKKFIKGTKAAGGVFIYGDRDSEHLYLCEGIATAHAVWVSTGVATVACFSAGNITNVAKKLGKKRCLTICLEHDHAGRETYNKLKNLKLNIKFIAAPQAKGGGGDFCDVYVQYGEVGVQEAIARGDRALHRLLAAKDFSKLVNPVGEIPSTELMPCRYYTDAVSALQACWKLDSNSIIGLDIETTGLYPHLGAAAATMQLWQEGTDPIVINLNKCGGLGAFSEFLKAYKFVAHNAVFEMSFLGAAGIDIELDCTQIAHHSETGQMISLEDLSLEYLGFDYGLYFGSKKAMQLSNWGVGVLSPEQIMYAATDAWTVVKLWHLLPRNERVYQRMKAAQRCAVMVTSSGIALDEQEHKAFIEEKTVLLDKAAQELSKVVPGLFKED